MQIQSIEKSANYESISIKSVKTETESFDLNKNGEKDRIDFFKDICNRYPGASFYVESGNEDTSYNYAGISDTRNFGDPGVRSYCITEEVLEKMKDPEYEKKLYGVLDFMESNSEYNRHVAHSEEKYKYVMIEDTHGTAVNQLYCSIMGSSSPMKYIKSVNEDGNRDVSIFDHQAMLKKISYFAEERYYTLVEDLFSEKKKEENFTHKDLLEFEEDSNSRQEEANRD